MIRWFHLILDNFTTPIATLLIQIKKQESIKNLRGKLHWDDDLEKMRVDS
jgi:hypothetical protein